VVLAVLEEVRTVTTYVANESEHRRGLVLGLTLAEILLLLLFLLLLALGARINRLNNEIRNEQAKSAGIEATMVELAPLLAELKLKGEIEIGAVRDLASRLSSVRTLEQRVGELQALNASLNQKQSILEELGPRPLEKLRGFEEVLALAARIDPADPPALLKRALSIIQHTGLNNLDISQHSALLESAMARAAIIDPQNPPAVLERSLDTFEQLTAVFKPEELNSLAKTMAGLHEETDRYRRERDNLMRSGRGLVFPSCWTNENGDTEYIFDVSIRDSGVVVKDSGPAYRKSHEAWKFVDEFARDVEIPETKFRNATTRLLKWSQGHDCRFVVTMRDYTEPTSKDRYKALRTLVEQNFYVKPVDTSAATSKPRVRTPSTREPGPVVVGTPPPAGDTRQMGGPFVPVPRQYRQ
jgi:hypothetical protein